MPESSYPSLPGARVIATVPSSSRGGGGDFYFSKAAGLANALRSAFDREQARREEQRQRELDEIKTFYEMAMRDKTLAAAQGGYFKQKYGASYPQVGALADALQNSQALVKDAQAAGDEFYNILGEIETKYARDRAALDAMPDTVSAEVPVPMPFGGGTPMGSLTLPIPNAQKAVAAAQLEQINPGLFQHVAAARMTPKQRAAARLAGAYTQPEFEPFGDDLPPELRAMWAVTAGYAGAPTGDIAQATRSRLGLIPSAAELQKQEYETTKEKASAAAQLTQLRESDTLQRAREEQQHGNEMVEIEARGRNARAGGRGGRGRKGEQPLWRTAIEESQSRLKAWTDGLEQTMSEASKGAQASDTTDISSARAAAAAKAKNLYVLGGSESGANGRPKPLSVEGARAIARLANELSPDDPEAMVAALVERYSTLTQQRNSSEAALKKVMEEARGGVTSEAKQARAAATAPATAPATATATAPAPSPAPARPLGSIGASVRDRAGATPKPTPTPTSAPPALSAPPPTPPATSPTALLDAITDEDTRAKIALARQNDISDADIAKRLGLMP